MNSIEEVQTVIKSALKVYASPKVQRRAKVQVNSSGYICFYIPGSLTVKGSTSYFWQKESMEEIIDRVKFISTWSEDFETL